MSDAEFDFGADPASEVLSSAERLIASGRAELVAGSIVTELTDPATWKRSRAVRRMLEIPSADALAEPFVELLGEGEQHGVRNAARSALAELASPRSQHCSTTTDALINALEHAADSDVRLLAATALGEAGNAKSRPALERALDDKDLNVAAAAAEALGLIGDRRSVPALANALEEGPFWLQVAAAFGLGSLRDARGLPALGNAARDQNLSVPVATAIGKIGDPRGIDLLRDALEGGGEGRRVALDALARIYAESSPGAPPQWLRETVADSTSELIADLATDRDADAARLLGIAATDEAVGALLGLLDDPDRSSLAAIGIHHLDPGKRKRIGLEAAAIESEIGQSVAIDLLPSLASPEEVATVGEFLASPSQLVRNAAAAALGRSDPDLALPYLEEALGDPARKLGAAIGLSHFGRRRCDPLMNLLRDKDAAVRSVAARSIGRCISDDISPLVDALDLEEDASVKQALLTAIGESGAPAAVDRLVTALSVDDAVIRFTAVRALGRTGLAAAVEPLLGALEDPSSDVRIASLIALGDLGETGDPRATSAVADHLARDDADVRQMAIRSMVRLADRDALPRVSGALNDPDEGVRMTAVETLRRIGNRSTVDALSDRIDIEPAAAVRDAASRAIVDLRETPDADPS